MQVQEQYVIVQSTIHRLVNICLSTSTICTSTIHKLQTSQYMCQYKYNTQYIDQSIYLSVQVQYVLVQYVLVQSTIHRQVNICRYCVGTRTICTSKINNTQTSQYMFKYKNNMYQFNTQFIDKSICVSTSTICTSTIHNTQTSQYMCQYKYNMYQYNTQYIDQSIYLSVQEQCVRCESIKVPPPLPAFKRLCSFFSVTFWVSFRLQFCYKRTNKTESNFLSYGRLSNNRNTC